MSAMYGVQSKAGDACFLARENKVIHAPSHAGQWSTWPQRLKPDEGESRSKHNKITAGEHGLPGEGAVGQLMKHRLLYKFPSEYIPQE